MNISYNWLNIIQNYLLPPTCILCGSPGFQDWDLCEGCYRDLPRNSHCCYQCAEILPAGSQPPALCGRCLSHRPDYDETYAPYSYQGAIRHLIGTLKFNAHFKNARLLGLLLAEHLQQTAQLPDYILPIPLHKTRYRERGFNQSIEIARTVGKCLKIPLLLNCCERSRDTPHQTRLSARQRRTNIKNAFTLVQPPSAQHIAVLDDVMTTGATAQELAKVLKKAGVSKVDVWVCARA